MFSKLFGGKQNRPVDEPDQEESLVIVPLLPLAELLVAKQQQKGAPLTEAEVLEARDNAVCMRVSQSTARRMEEKRGYRDFDPENVWTEWQAYVASEEA